jgi:antitoxin component YwqK of YwqJK toxin-antitoxin module
VKAQDGQYKSGRRAGVWTAWGYDGGRLSTVDYRDDGRVRLVMSTQEGRLTSEDWFRAQEKHGPSIRWHSDGQTKRREGAYFAGQPDGEWFLWDEQGAVRAHAQYDKGQLIKGTDIAAEEDTATEWYFPALPGPKTADP